MSNIFVSGANGFLGRHLVNFLVKNGYEVTAPTSKKCDLCDFTSLEKWSNERFEYIIHLAAWTQAGDFCLFHPGEQWIINQKINTNILEWWSKNQQQSKLIFMGTSCSYPVGEELREENYLIGTPIESLYTYAMTKRMLLIGAQSLSKQYGLKYLCVVPSTLYGNNYHDDGRQMHFIFDLVRKIYNAGRGGPIPTLWGDGSQEREIIHVNDFINALYPLMDSVSNEVVNIGSGKAHTIKTFANLICDICNYDSDKIEYDTTKYVGAKSKCLDIKKLESYQPNFSNRDLKEGLREIVEWYAQSTSYRK